MSATITVELSPSALATLAQFRELPRKIPEAIQTAMTRSLEVVTGRIIEKRLSGKGPFPVEEHRLGQRTQQLVRSTRPTPARIISTGDQTIIEGAIGASVVYAAIHEFGGTITRSISTKAGKGKHPKQAHQRQSTVTMPERAPFRTGIGDNLDYIRDEIEKEIMATLET